MRKILFAFIFSGFFLLLQLAAFQTAPGQTENVAPNNQAEEDDAWLRSNFRSDLRTADVAAYVNVKEIKPAGRSDAGTDCENNSRGGYCSYLLIAEIKELFKGDVKTKTLEFYTGTESGYPQKGLLGEKIVFLVWNENEKDRTKSLGTIENSSFPVKDRVLEIIRKIVDPQAEVDDLDESNPYSLKAIRESFAEADAVVYADVVSFRPDTEDSGSFAHLLKAKVKESFKGKLIDGQEIEYREDLLYRPIRDGDLGEQILYLKKTERDGKVFYERMGRPESLIRHNILEKLRKVSAEKLNRKN